MPKSKTKAIRDLCVQYLTCADARISHESEGHDPLPEMRKGEDTGRIAHRVNKNSVTLLFKGEEVLVDFTSF